MLRAPILGLCLAGAALIFDSGAARAHETHAHDPAAEVETAKVDPGVDSGADSGAGSGADSRLAVSPFPADIGGAFALIDHGGRAVTEADFRGRFMLIFFGFARCEGICPVGLQRMTAAIDLLGEAGAELQPLLITVDPENDTPEVLAERVAEIHPRLIGLTGTPEAVAAAQRAYKVDAKPTGQSWKGAPLIRHGSFLYLMGPGGELLTVLPPVLGPQQMAEILRRYLS